MWILLGPFDEGGDMSVQKSKLLKAGENYSLGRKDCLLIVANKKISGHHCEFNVKAFSSSNVGDPRSRPVIEFFNSKDKGMHVLRGNERILVNPRECRELQDGDVVALLVSLIVESVKWIPLCCYVQPVMGKSPVSIDICASLGIHIVHVPDPDVTHHIIPSYTAQPLIAASLLSSCSFAKLEWLNEVIRLGTLQRDANPAQGVSLENTFELPSLNKYRPTFSPSLPTSQKKLRVWEPNEERLGMLAPFRFLYIDEKPRLGDLKTVIDRGGGSFETFDVSSGKTKFHRALSRGQAKEDKKQVIIGRAKSAIAAVGKTAWNELVEEANSFGLSILEPDVVIQVIIDFDLSLFDVSPALGVDAEDSPTTSLPDIVPNTHSEEPSFGPTETEKRSGPTRRLVRRATSRQTSLEPSAHLNNTPEPEPEELAHQPRKALKRRTNAGKPVITGIDDPSAILDSTPEVPTLSTPLPQPENVVDLVLSTPVRPRNLKRRLGGVAPNDQASQPAGFALQEPLDDPPLKKFKALFDASNPENISAGTFDINEDILDSVSQTAHGLSSQSQTQTQSQSETRPRTMRSAIGANLSTLREEEEETQNSPTERGTKRTLHERGDSDADDGGVVSGSNTSKKRAIENVNAVQNTGTTYICATSKPPSTATRSKGGAESGQPDQDTRFLKAIASTKKRKQGEDDFDRDFNNLRISRPELEREEPVEEWAVVADFGDDLNIRGNFMVMVEMPVYSRGRKSQKDQPLPEWVGKPNFKKFQKKNDVTRHRHKVELFLSDGNDYGVGPAYWKGAESQSQSQSGSQQKTGAQGHTQPLTQHLGKSQTPAVVDERVRHKSKSEASRVGSVAPPRRASTRSKKTPLFIDSDNNDDATDARDFTADADMTAPVESDEEPTLRSTRTKKSQNTKTTTHPSKKTAALILVDDDSDDGAVFKGFKGHQRRR